MRTTNNKKMESNKKNSPLRVATLTTPDAVLALRDTWCRWNTHPNTEIDRFLAVIASRKEALRPHVLVVYAEDKPIAMLVGRLDDATFDLKVGYKILINRTARVVSILHSGLLGESSDAVHRALLSELLRTLSHRDVEAVVLHFLRVESELYGVIRDVVRPWQRDHFAMRNAHWSIALPRTYDDYLRTLSRSTRRSIRRRTKFIKGQFGDSLTIRRLASASELDEMLRDIESVAAKAYQRSLGAGFRHDRETRKSMELALAEGRLSVFVLYHNGNPIAFDSACRCRDAIFLNECGYDPQYANYGLGTFLLCRQIEQACGDPEVRRIDFGFGPSSYKESLGSEHWHEKSICIFAPSLRGVALNLLRSSSNGVHHLLHRLLTSVGVFEKVRGVLRSRQLMDSVKQIPFKAAFCVDLLAEIKLL